MAVSGLEQRQVPLVVASSVWSPWGPGMLTPYPEEDEESGDEHDMGMLKPIIRSSSWAGFPTYAQESRRCPTYVRATSNSLPSSTDSMDDPGTPTTIMSDPTSGYGSTRQRRSQFNQRIIAKPSEIVLAPVLLGNSMCIRMASKMDSKCVDEMAKVDQSLRVTTGTDAASMLPEKEIENAVITTLMIRNLPYSLTQQEMLQALDESGYGGLYDFVYLPHKFKERKNLGFAFVNFVNAEVGKKFSTEWHHTYRFKLGFVRKPLNISAAATQGRKANERAAKSQKMSRVKNNFFRPVCVLDDSAHSAVAL